MSVNVVYRTSAFATGGPRWSRSLAGRSPGRPIVHAQGTGRRRRRGREPRRAVRSRLFGLLPQSLKVAGQKTKVKIPAVATVTATIGMGARSEGGFGVTADRLISLPGVSREEAEGLVAAAHQICPYSNATRNNINVGLSVG